MQTSRGKSLFMAASWALLVGGCTPGSNLPLLHGNSDVGAYRLSTDDQVRVTTFGEQNLSGDFGVDGSGYIAIPLLGPVRADGLTTEALAGEIVDKLKSRKILTDPNVVVEVVKYRPIFVLGEVQRPGQFPYQIHMTLLNAVALAGGFTPRAYKHHAEVVRNVSGTPDRGRLDEVSTVEPGDVITVLERNF